MARATKDGQYRHQRVRRGMTFRIVEGEPFNPHWMAPADDDAPDQLAAAGTGAVQAPGGAPERPKRTRSSAEHGKDDRDVI